MSEGLVLTSVDGPAHKPTCGHVAGNHHLRPAPPTARPAICCHPVTASDARPPSDTGTTGWHRHVSGRCKNMRRHVAGDLLVPCSECYSIESTWRCIPWEPNSEQPTDRIVVDPAAAHEPLADLIAHHDAYRVNDDGWVVCICGNVAEGDDDDGSHARHVTELILAALAGQGQP